MIEPSESVVAKYRGCYIGQFPVLRPFKSKYVVENGSSLETGVFVIVPFEEYGSAEILDLTHTDKDDKMYR